MQSLCDRALRQVHGGRPCLTSCAQIHSLSRLSRRPSLSVRATDNSATEFERGSNIIISGITTEKDTETFQDVMSFKGSAPERVNGRAAMWAFLFIVLAERGEHIGAVEQFAKHPWAAFFTALFITVGSILPKFSSSRSLAQLHEAASRDGLPPQLRFFNKTHEIWVGRVAMLGLTGLIATELILKGGEPLFG